jgi:hypothetical protein
MGRSSFVKAAGHYIEPLQHKRESLSKVPNDDLQVRILIEYSAQNEPNDMNGGLNVPTPPGTSQHLIDYG